MLALLADGLRASLRARLVVKRLGSLRTAGNHATCADALIRNTVGTETHQHPLATAKHGLDPTYLP